MPVPREVTEIPLRNGSKQIGINKTLLYNGSCFKGYQKSKGNSYEVEVVLQVSVQVRSSGRECRSRLMGSFNFSLVTFSSSFHLVRLREYLSYSARFLEISVIKNIHRTFLCQNSATKDHFEWNFDNHLRDFFFAGSMTKWKWRNPTKKTSLICIVVEVTHVVTINSNECKKKFLPNTQILFIDAFFLLLYLLEVW